MRRTNLGWGRRGEICWRLLHYRWSDTLSLLGGGWLLPLCGAGYLGKRGLLESGRLKGLVWGGGTTGDGRAQECIQMGTTAQNGR